MTHVITEMGEMKLPSLGETKSIPEVLAAALGANATPERMCSCWIQGPAL